MNSNASIVNQLIIHCGAQGLMTACLTRTYYFDRMISKT
jgi:hypothetical protein